MLRKLWVLPVDIRLAAHMNKLKFRPRAYSYIGKVPVIDLFDKPLAEWDIVVKSIFDRLVGVFCLLALAPVMALVALAVKLDSKRPHVVSPEALRLQQRADRGLQVPLDVHRISSTSRRTSSSPANDPRVTRVGRIHPQDLARRAAAALQRRLQGQPLARRPAPARGHAKAAEELYDEVVDSYFARHRVRPGITGWAQIHGWRGETDTSEKIQKRVECDLFYIENWSIFLDLYVLVMTPIALLKTKDAY